MLISKNIKIFQLNLVILVKFGYFQFFGLFFFGYFQLFSVFLKYSFLKRKNKLNRTENRIILKILPNSNM